MPDKNPTKIPNCFDCQHFYVTWDPNQPRGCRAFGFKSKQMPAMEVFQASGEACHLFFPKKPQPHIKKDPKDSSGWTA